MGRTHIVVDSNNLAYRSFYSMGGLSYQGIASGVYYGFFGTILQLQGKFGNNNFIFAFDSKKSERKKVCSSYKETRTERTSEELEKLWDLFQQIQGLREKYLPQIGFKNIFRQVGYEADDIIASVCTNLKKNDKAIIISTDADLYQLLNKRVSIYDPKKKFLWTPKLFTQQFGLTNPEDWAIVKAIAGCGSDEVKGIKGVGEKTAIKFLNQTLSIRSKTYLNIVSKEGIAIRKRNLPLVKLPYPGTKVFKIKQDDELDWRDTLFELGIRSLNPDIQYRGEPT